MLATIIATCFTAFLSLGYGQVAPDGNIIAQGTRSGVNVQSDIRRIHTGSVNAGLGTQSRSCGKTKMEYDAETRYIKMTPQARQEYVKQHYGL